MAVLVVAAAAAGWMYGAAALGLGWTAGWAEPSGGGPPEAAGSGLPRSWDAVRARAGSLPAGDEGQAIDPVDGAAPDVQEPTAAADPVRQGAESPETSKRDHPPPFVEHRVSPGETLWDIARAYGTDVTSISRANHLYRIDVIQPGQVLTVPTVKGVVHTVERGESLWDIGQMYGVDPGRIVEVNRLADPDRISPGQVLVIPGVDGPRLERVVVGGRLQRVFQWPVRGRISSRFGWRWGRLHEGIDIAVPRGTPVRAAAPGRVTYARWGGGYGYLVAIDHGNGVITRYAHNSRIVVREGQRVARGQLLAYSGSTGSSTGPHLHFEIRYRGRAVDPLAFLR